MNITTRIKMVWAAVAPHLSTVSSIGWNGLGLAWSTLLVTLKPFWVPAVTLARNPLTAIMVSFAVIVSYLVGMEVSNVRNHETIISLERRHDAELRERDAILKTNVTMLLKEKAALVEELDAAKKANDTLEAKIKPKAAVVVKPKAKPQPKTAGLF